MASAPKIESITDAPIIPFIQFVAPNGHTREVTIEVAPDVAATARAAIAMGLSFECEVLMSGEASLTITHPEDGDLDIEVVPNGPGVREAVERLVRRFAKRVPA